MLVNRTVSGTGASGNCRYAPHAPAASAVFAYAPAKAGLNSHDVMAAVVELKQRKLSG